MNAPRMPLLLPSWGSGCVGQIPEVMKKAPCNGGLIVVMLLRGPLQLATGAGRRLGLKGCLTLQFLLVEGKEIHRIEIEGRKAAIAGDIGNDAAREGEDHARAFDQQERVQLFLRHAFDLEQAHIIQFDNEQRLVIGFVLAR
jgi:hypothetical protein